jgi:hypothetical protein
MKEFMEITPSIPLTLRGRVERGLTVRGRFKIDGDDDICYNGGEVKADSPS